MTVVHRIVQTASTWMPRAGAAVMPITVTVAGDTSSLVPDLCVELSNRLPWGVYGDSIVPSDAAPRGTVKPSARIVGGLVVSVDATQPAPEYEDGSAKPSYSEVRLMLTQPITSDLSDLGRFISRRAEVCAVLASLNGTLTGGPAPVTIAGEFSAEFSRAFDAVT